MFAYHVRSDMFGMIPSIAKENLTHEAHSWFLVLNGTKIGIKMRYSASLSVKGETNYFVCSISSLDHAYAY